MCTLSIAGAYLHHAKYAAEKAHQKQRLLGIGMMKDSVTYRLLTEKEVNTGYLDRVKDQGEAEVLYDVNISSIDWLRGQ